MLYKNNKIFKKPKFFSGVQNQNTRYVYHRRGSQGNREAGPESHDDAERTSGARPSTGLFPLSRLPPPAPLSVFRVRPAGFAKLLHVLESV